MRVSSIFLYLFFVCFSDAVASKGELHDFEKDAIFKRGAGVVEIDRDSGDQCGIIWILLSACGIDPVDKSLVEYLPDSEYSNVTLKNSGAYFRVDGQYQYTKTDVSGISLDMESSKNGFGVRAKLTKFSEVVPDSDLNYFQFHGLFMPQEQGSFSLSLGAGVGVLRGEHSTVGISFYIPIRYRLSHFFSVEAYGSITNLNKNPILDTRLSIKASYKRVSVLISYLSLASPNESIHGPAFGLSFQF